jgi:hypothetical protein
MPLHPILAAQIDQLGSALNLDARRIAHLKKTFAAAINDTAELIFGFPVFKGDMLLLQTRLKLMFDQLIAVVNGTPLQRQPLAEEVRTYPDLRGEVPKAQWQTPANLHMKFLDTDIDFLEWYRGGLELGLEGRTQSTTAGLRQEYEKQETLALVVRQQLKPTLAEMQRKWVGAIAEKIHECDVPMISLAAVLTPEENEQLLEEAKNFFKTGQDLKVFDTLSEMRTQHEEDPQRCALIDAAKEALHTVSSWFQYKKHLAEDVQELFSAEGLYEGLVDKIAGYMRYIRDGEDISSELALIDQLKRATEFMELYSTLLKRMDFLRITDLKDFDLAAVFEKLDSEGRPKPKTIDTQDLCRNLQAPHGIETMLLGMLRLTTAEVRPDDFSALSLASFREVIRAYIRSVPRAQLDEKAVERQMSGQEKTLLELLDYHSHHVDAATFQQAAEQLELTARRVHHEVVPDEDDIEASVKPEPMGDSGRGRLPPLPPSTPTKPPIAPPSRPAGFKPPPPSRPPPSRRRALPAESSSPGRKHTPRPTSP